MEPAEVALPPPPASEALVALQPMLRRYLFTLGAPVDRLDDLIQQTFVVTLEKRPEDRGPAALGGWLRGVARNLLLRERRSAAARREVELADEVWREQFGEEGDSALVEALRVCLRRLPQRGRELLQRVYGDGLERLATGAAFGLAGEGIKTALRRLRAALKQCVRERLENLE
ncbi:MAG: sigma factor [Planctomycetota bacterium]